MSGSTKLGLSIRDECRLIQINDKLLLRAAKFKSWIACFSNSEVLADIGERIMAKDRAAGSAKQGLLWRRRPRPCDCDSVDLALLGKL